MSDGPLVYLVAGEPSGDRLGAGLMRALREQAPGVRFAGLGGQEMTAAGLSPLFDIGELSVMGLAEVVPRLPALLRRLRQMTEAAVGARPDILVTIDSPSFSLRVAQRVRRRLRDLPTVHYVAPSVWAWRPGRARHMARFIDHVLALLPFEPPFMQAAGMGCTFVGHPVAARPVPGADEVARYRERLGLGRQAPLLLLAPGSRQGEVRRLLPVFRETVERIRRPGMKLVVPLAETVAGAVAAGLDGLEPRPHLVQPEAGEAEKRLAIAAADAALVASGTVTLEMAAAGTPMVAAYRAQPFTAAIVRRLLKVDTVNLVNLVSGTRAVPEFLQEWARADLIAPALTELLDRGPAHARQREVMETVMAALGRGGEPPSARAAHAVLEVLGRASRPSSEP